MVLHDNEWKDLCCIVRKYVPQLALISNICGISCIPSHCNIFAQNKTMLEPWRTGKVIRIEEATINTKRFWIAVQDVDRFDFLPGQFVTLDLPIHEKRNKRWRSYSIASYPDGTNVIELVIVLLEGGVGTHYLFNEIKVGSELQLRGPQGVFILPKEIDKNLFLICTGTGVAPFRSMFIIFINTIFRTKISISFLVAEHYLIVCIKKN